MWYKLRYKPGIRFQNLTVKALKLEIFRKRKTQKDKGNVWFQLRTVSLMKEMKKLLR